MRESYGMSRSRGGDLVDEHIRLRSGGALGNRNASDVLKGKGARVIVIVGPTASGKTSLIAGVYDLFQIGEVGTFAFCGSRTLPAFERICHDTRSVSRRRTPDTVRTPIGAVSFYHLELINACTEGRGVSLLLADRAGEEYLSSMDDVTNVQNFDELYRADSVSILVDGEKILDRARHNLVNEVKMVLQGIRDGGGLSNLVPLAIVLTKLDAVESSEHRDRGWAAFHRLVRDIRMIFGDAVAKIDVFHVAASPKTQGAVKGAGMDDLITFWMENRRPTRPTMRDPVRSSRAFGRFGSHSD